MGCMCCRDREKTEDVETKPLTILPSHHSDAVVERKPTLTSNTRKGKDANLAPTKSKQVKVVVQEAGDRGRTTETEESEGGKDIRTVVGGAARSYELEQGSGALVRAQHRDSGKQCWVRTYEWKRDESDKEIRQQLVLMRSLDHPNVLKMLDLFQDEGHCYAVYEATEGGNAEELAARCKGLSEKWGAALMRQVFTAVSYCHSKDLHLKALSAKHILLAETATEEHSTVKLLVPLGEEAAANACIAPELKTKSNVGKVNDLWNCGVLLSTLLAGDCVFMQASFTSQEFRSAYTKWQEVSKDAKSFTLALIARDVNKRPSVEKCLQHPWVTAS